MSDNTSLTLERTIDNKGTITLGGAVIGDSLTNGNGGGGDPDLVIDGHVKLEGHGEILLSEREGFPNQDFVVSGDHGGTLVNVNNTIEGAGTIGDGNLTLVNEACGVINANGEAGLPLVVDTGHHEVVNKGLMEATSGGELDINSDLFNTGTLAADDGLVHACRAGAVHGHGSDTISNGGTLNFLSYVSAHQTVSFGDPGTLVVSNSADFHASVSNFAVGDTIDAADVKYTAGEYAVWTQSSTANSGYGTLALYTSGGALEDTLHLNGNYPERFCAHGGRQFAARHRCQSGSSQRRGDDQRSADEFCGVAGCA